MFKDRGNTIIILLTGLCVGGMMCAALALGIAFKGSGNGLGVGNSLVNKAAPDFTLQSSGGKQVSLSQYRGRPVMLNFWATWCGPCVQELPLIQKRYQQYNDSMIVLAIDQCEDSQTVKNFIRDEKLLLPVLLDPTCEVGGDQYSVNAYPTSVFIDAEGVVKSVYIGSMSDSILDQNLRLIGIGK